MIQTVISPEDSPGVLCPSCTRIANSWARIKPTAPLSVFDKENSMEFLLDFLYYLYNYYMVCALSSHTHHVTSYVTPCDVTLWHPIHVTVTCDTCDVTLSHTPFCVVSPKEKEKKKKRKVNINNNLVVLPSHDIHWVPFVNSDLE